MAKIKVRGSIGTVSTKETFESLGILRDNKIIWNDLEKKYQYQLNLSTCFFRFETEEYILTLPFVKEEITQGTMYLKKEELTVSLPVDTYAIEINQKKIEIVYHMEEDDDLNPKILSIVIEEVEP